MAKHIDNIGPTVQDSAKLQASGGKNCDKLGAYFLLGSLMRRLRHIVFVVLGLTLISPLLAGAGAWGYVDEAQRIGAVYFVLFKLPLALCHLVTGDNYPSWELLLLAYLLQYSVFSFAGAGVWWLVRRLWPNRSSKPTPDGAA